MKLIVGLGNPGKKYVNSRHNVGFMVLDRIFPKKDWKKVGDSLVCERERAVYAKPQSFMNNSGQEILKLSGKYYINPEDILVIRDDVDMELGKVRGPKDDTGSGGHKGVESVISQLGTQYFYQLKIGVGRPPDDVETDKWVLFNFKLGELEVLKPILNLREVIEEWVSN